MNTNNHSAAGASDVDAMEAELRARVPAWMKQGVEAVAKPRTLQNPDILREAVIEYLAARGIKAPESNSQPVERAA